MLLRARRRLLTLASLLLVVGAALIATWVVIMPTEIPSAPVDHGQLSVVRSSDLPRAAPRPPLGDFAVLWDRPLRHPLFDPPPIVDTPPAPPPPPPLTLRLVGTILEPGRPMAVLVNASGKIEMKTIGQTAGDPAQPAEILEVERDRIVVRYVGETRELQLEAR